MAKKKRTRTPVYDAADAAILKSAGIDHRTKQPFGTINAVREVNPSQRDRITHISKQERVVKDSEGRVDTCFAACVQQVHSAIGLLKEEAQIGWLDYAELWESAQPSQSMNYGERITGGKTALRDENRDPAWMEAAGRMRLLNRKLSRSVSTQADNFMRVRETLAVNAIVLAMLEGVGNRLYGAFTDMEGDS